MTVKESFLVDLQRTCRNLKDNLEPQCNSEYFSGHSALWTGIHTDIGVADIPGHFGVLIPKLVLL